MKIKDESGESIVIGEKITTTLKDPQGNVRKITTIDTYKEDSGKLNNGHKHSRLSVTIKKNAGTQPKLIK